MFKKLLLSMFIALIGFTSVNAEGFKEIKSELSINSDFYFQFRRFFNILLTQKYFPGF